jgi:hypothetical protein
MDDKIEPSVVRDEDVGSMRSTDGLTWTDKEERSLVRRSVASSLCGEEWCTATS